ncbi:MAG: 7TM diverse intracellular signaling domain-containing protein [Bacteroidota bacterium]
MVKKVFLVFIFCLLGQLSPGQISYPYNVDLESSGFLLTSKEVSFEQIKDSVFRSYHSYPELQQRRLGKAVWIKSTIISEYTSELILDFLRKDYVDLYLLDGERLMIHSKTGFLLPSSEKSMQRWNAIDIILLADREYTVYYRIVNEVNDLDLNINVNQRGDWRRELLYGIIKDIAFLSVMFIISVYMLLTYFQNKSKTYLYLALYLLVVCLFYAFILDIMRDFFITESPHITLYTVSLALLGPCFYIGFARDYLNTKKLIPVWDKRLAIIARIDLLVFVLAVIIFRISNDYYLLVDIVRVSLATNLIAGLILIFLLRNKRNPLLYYYMVGSAFMLVSTAIDLILWTEAERLGNIAQLGYIGEIIVFSMGLAKRNQIAEKEKKIAQDSYINQLKINEKSH